MRVKCIINTIRDIRKHGYGSFGIENYFHFDDNYELLNLDEEFEVFALMMTSNGIWIFVLEEDDDFPKQFPLFLFKTIDPSIPQDWTVGRGRVFESSQRKVFSLLTHRDWACDESFYERLVEGDGDAKQKLKKSFYPFFNRVK